MTLAGFCLLAAAVIGGALIALCLVGIFGSHSSIADWSAVVIGFAIAWFVLPKT